MDTNHMDDGSSSDGTEMEIMPGYIELITRAYSVIFSAFRDCKDCGLELSSKTLLDHAYITWMEIFMFFMCAVMWTKVRRGLAVYIFEVNILQKPQLMQIQLVAGWYQLGWLFILYKIGVHFFFKQFIFQYRSLKNF